MAFTTMVKNAFAQQLIEFVREIESSHGLFTIAMLVPSDSGLVDRWNLVVSAKWIDHKELRPAIPTITSALLNHLSKVNVRKIERISPLSTKGSFVKDVVAEVPVAPGTAYRVQSFALNMRGIEHAIILVARDPRLARSRQPQVVRSRG